MKTSSYEYPELLTKIHGALALLDPTGTNETVTRAMSIVYEGFKRHENNFPFSANDLLITSIKLNKNGSNP